MAYVPGFEHDIFVSYSHRDNEVVPKHGVKTGWVSTLVDFLEMQLSSKLGDHSLWIDHELARDVSFSPQLFETLEKTATLLVMLSPGYLQSEWCRRERNSFLSAVSKHRTAGGSVFAVERDRLENGDLPEFDELTRFRFWEPTEGNRTRVLGWPKPNTDDPSHEPYFDRIEDLATDVVKRLKNLKKNAEGERAEPVQESKGTVFLAEVTDDLSSKRETVKKHLEQEAIRVVPEVFYRRDPVAFREAMERDLAGSKLFVQLLSQETGALTLDLPRGYLGLQLEAAGGAGLPIMHWRDREIDLSNVADKEHLEVLESETVQAVSIGDFKAGIVEQMLEKERPPTISGTKVFVFIATELSDRELAAQVRAVVDEAGVGCGLTLTDGSPEAVRRDTEESLELCDALVVLYGNSPNSWVRAQLRLLWKHVKLKGRDWPALAVYKGPPSSKPDVGINFRGLETLDGSEGLNEEALREFLSSVAGSGGG